MSSTWKLVNLGDRKYRLETASSRLIGWIQGHAIGLSGLRDAGEALEWAPALRRALDDALVRQYPDRYRPVEDLADLRLVHDGAYEWIAAGDVPIGRLHRPSSNRPAGCLTVEFVLPSYASEEVTIACAEILATMLYDGILARSLDCEGGEAPSRRVATGRGRHGWTPVVSARAFN